MRYLILYLFIHCDKRLNNVFTFYNQVNAIADSVYNKTPLHIAVGANFVGTARLLIENGADLDAQDKGKASLSPVQLH